MQLGWERAILGLALVAVGVLWFLGNLGLVTVDFGELVGRYWPVVLIYLGLASLLPRRLRGRPVAMPERFGGLLLAIVGVLFLAGNLNWLGERSPWSLFWPLLLILIGVQGLLGSSDRPAASGAVGGRSEGGLFSGVHRTPLGELGPASYWSVFGTVRLDLTRATLPPGETVLTVTTWFGSGEILLPEGVPVAATGSNLFGSVVVLGERRSGIGDFRVESPGYRDAERRLHVVIHSVFGNMEVHRWS